MTSAIAEEHDTGERPVTAFRKDDIKVPISIDVADAGVCCGFGDRFERHYFERT